MTANLEKINSRSNTLNPNIMLASVLMYKQLLFSSSQYITSLSQTKYVVYFMLQVNNWYTINKLLLSSTNHR